MRQVSGRARDPKKFNHPGRLLMSFVHMERLKKRSYNVDRYTAFAPESLREHRVRKSVYRSIPYVWEAAAGAVTKEQRP
jgi:hypothetical protein